MIRFRRRRASALGERVDEPPLTPMIDIVFQLLVFFLLTMQFKEVEGKLLSQLPRGPGLPSAETDVWEEVRIVICAGGDTRAHLHDKGRHERQEKSAAVCEALVERHPVGRLVPTEGAPGGTAEANRRAYRAVGEKVAEIRPRVRTSNGKPARVVLDADREVPYEHVIGVVNACKEAGIDDLQFAGNSLFERYYR